MRPADAAVYVVSDPVLKGDRPLGWICEQVFSSGIKLFQLRDKQATTRALVEQARELVAIAAESGGTLLVNDRVDVALAAGAHGVHLGQDDLALADARCLLGPERIVGVSVRSADEARRAERAGADYLAANLVFATATKTDIARPLGLDGLRALRSASRLPLVAIGGIDASNAAEVVAAGADGVAVVSAVMAAADPAAACRDLLAAVARGQKIAMARGRKER